MSSKWFTQLLYWYTFILNGYCSFLKQTSIYSYYTIRYSTYVNANMFKKGLIALFNYYEVSSLSSCNLTDCFVEFRSIVPFSKSVAVRFTLWMTMQFNSLSSNSVRHTDRRRIYQIWIHLFHSNRENNCKLLWWMLL